MRWRSSTTWSARPGSTSQGTLLQTTGFNRPGFPGMGCWVSYGLGSAEREPADVRRAAGPPRAGVQRHEELGQRVPARPAPGDARSTPAPRRPSKTCSRTSGRSSSHVTRTKPASTCSHNSTATTRPRVPATSGSTRASRATSWPRRCSSRPRRRSTSRRRRRRRSSCTASTTAKGTFDKEINPLEETDYFGRKCLVARRLLERGVRFVQIWSGNDNGFPRRNWDSHEDVKRDHGPLAYGMARGAAALIADLKRAGPARRHDRPVDDRVRPDAVSRRAARAATTTRTASPTGSRRRGQGRASRTARATTSATSPPTASTRPRCTTSTPPSCTCSASTTRS